MPTETEWERLLERAWERRQVLHQAADTNAYRLLNRAGDGFPEIAVDRYANVLVAYLYTRGKTTEPPHVILEWLAERVQARAIYLKYRPLQARTLDGRTREELAPPVPWWGTPVESIEVQENGLHFLIRPAEGLSCGLFLDMRNARAFIRSHVGGMTVLNCFAYTCAFGVAALAGGAKRVLNLDISRRYLEWGKENTERNGFAVIPSDFVRGDVFDWLSRFARRNERFDLVIIDPPSFATTRKSRFSAEQNYARLVSLGAAVVQPGGWLIACTNCAQLSSRAFVRHVQAGLQGYNARIVRIEHEPTEDFPVAPGGQPYLKVCLIRFM